MATIDTLRAAVREIPYQPVWAAGYDVDAQLERGRRENALRTALEAAGRDDARTFIGTLPTATPLSCWSCGRTEDASEPSEDRCAVCGCKQ